MVEAIVEDGNISIVHFYKKIVDTFNLSPEVLVDLEMVILVLDFWEKNYKEILENIIHLSKVEKVNLVRIDLKSIFLVFLVN